MTHEEKIEHSIALLKRAEKLALNMHQDGYYVAFSGGKDSQCVLELCKMAGVKYTAHYNVTTMDAPDNVYFIRDHYPEVIREHPDMNMLNYIKKNGILPTMLRRYCCRYYKEFNGTDRLTITGVRSDESNKRNTEKELRFSLVNMTAKKRKLFTDREMNRDVNGLVEYDKMESVNFQCVNGKDKLVMHPILQWDEDDVWQFIRERNLPVNPLYGKFKRVGCMFCPFMRKKRIDEYVVAYPLYYKKFLKTIQYLIDECGYMDEFAPVTAEEVFNWWASKEPARDYFARTKSQLELDFGEDC